MTTRVVRGRRAASGGVGEALRTLKGLDDAFSEASSPDVIRLIRACVVLVLRDVAEDSAVNLAEFVEELVVAGLAVPGDMLFDCRDAKLQQMALLYQRLVHGGEYE